MSKKLTHIYYYINNYEKINDYYGRNQIFYILKYRKIRLRGKADFVYGKISVSKIRNHSKIFDVM